ncbi:MAG: chromosomal replication initiator protein, partial [Fimbriimonadaceae bacterium]|nr:chromosomal replication initiator protein [Fimbriimonadaceae bacterium]
VAVSHALANLLAYKMRGNGRTLVGALKRLRLYGPLWMDSRATLKACGILDPFFADNSAWDLKEQILRISCQTEFRYGRASGPDMAIFTMLREACLSEAEIARFLGIGPSEVYQRSAKFEEQASLSEPIRAQLNTFIESIVDSLLRE